MSPLGGGDPGVAASAGPGSEESVPGGAPSAEPVQRAGVLHAVVRRLRSWGGAIRQTVRQGVGRCAGWLTHRWRSSLEFRVVATTVFLCLVVMGLLQTFLYQRIADGLAQDRLASAKEDAIAGTQQIQSKLDKTDKTDLESIRQLCYDLISQQESQRGENARELILTKSQRKEAKDASLPTLDTGIDPSIVTPEMRDRLAKDGSHQVVAFVTLPRAGSDIPAVLVGSLVRVPEAGTYELYYVYPMDAQEQILGMVLRTFLLGVFIFAVLIGLISYVVTRLVVDPVREAAVVAERLAKGRLNERLYIKGEDDLATLGTAFNRMADTLQAQISRLEDLSAVQQRFVSDVSHELRTPLTTIRMASEVIFDSREEFPPVSRRSTEILHGEVERFEELLTDLLEISRFDAGAAALDRDNVDVRVVVERVLAGTSELARHRGSDMVLIAPDTPVRAEMDPRRVERIVRNLVVNAVEHGEGEPIRVEIAGNDTAVAIAVRDQGIGLKPGESDLVFTRFWRADPARKRTTGGTGLGLAISLEDARLHDGWLQAWGEPGRGSRFRLTLPRVAGRPIGYSPLVLADPDPDGHSEDGSSAGEPISAGKDPATGSLPQVPELGRDARTASSSVPAASTTPGVEPLQPDLASPAPAGASAVVSTEVPADTSPADSASSSEAAPQEEVTDPVLPEIVEDDLDEEIDELDRMPTDEELAEIELMERQAEEARRRERAHFGHDDQSGSTGSELGMAAPDRQEERGTHR
ncbi:Sensor histidine kinase RcsC [Austwickia sp. TVS 96-490-7B]|uniref:MtrAB system histidine kinase MtrB n=1 Tax=Austwickia sp. TVS 96-490-7B TaxID=2830843 RepID=UPI001C55CD90|nr:MtrAB system histidine kinase MtrB [Austwickia sp. TVS 96-490-7B]MBW3086784.1 Sensor histidine kinase RcsC [Austwickia sp. TVS 96-490-7B]